MGFGAICLNKVFIPLEESKQQRWLNLSTRWYFFLYVELLLRYEAKLQIVYFPFSRAWRRFWEIILPLDASYWLDIIFCSTMSVMEHVVFKANNVGGLSSESSFEIKEVRVFAFRNFLLDFIRRPMQISLSNILILWSLIGKHEAELDKTGEQLKEGVKLGRFIKLF